MNKDNMFLAITPLGKAGEGTQGVHIHTKKTPLA